MKKIKSLLKSKKFEYLILLAILIGAFGVRLYKIDNPIGDWHSWRQADTASVTRVYLKEGLDLLYPRYHDISRIQTGYFNPDGYRFVEFPIFNLLHYGLQNLMPDQTLAYTGRMVSVLTAVFGVFVLYLLGNKVIGKRGGLLTAFFYAFIPYNIYFTRVILPDPLATVAATTSLLLFYIYTEKENRLVLLSSGAMFAIAMLVKPQALFFAPAIAYLAVRKFGILGIFRNKTLLLTMDLAIIPFLLWRAWMNQLYLLRGIPYFKWAFNGDEIRFRPSFWFWIIGERLGNLILGSWGAVLFYFGLINKKVKVGVLYSLGFGMVLYVTVIATANVRHDYYQTYIMPFVALVLASGVMALWNFNGFNKYLVRLSVIFIIGMMLLVGWTRWREKYQVNEYQYIVAGEAADRLLPEDALVIAPANGDSTFLYQTNRSGWTVVNDDITNMIKKGATHYVATNFADPDVAMFKERFKVIEETDTYIIIDLTKPN